MESQSFIVSRADRIGDLLLALPALSFLTRNVRAAGGPSKRVYLHHSPYTHDIATLAVANGIADDLWTSGQAWSGADRHPHFLSLQHNDRVRSDLKVCGSKNSLGPRTKISTLWTYRRTLNQSRSRVEKSEMEYNVDLAAWALEQWGIPRQHAFESLPPLVLPTAWQSPELAQPRVVILSNRGSAGNWSWERWLRRFAKDESGGIDFLYYGERADEAKSFFAQAKDVVPGFRLLLNPFQKVSELAVYLQGAECVYASSTGPLHLAHALGVRVHGIYPTLKSSRVQSFQRWRPHGYRHAAPVTYEFLESES